MAQWFGMVACNADVLGSDLYAGEFFLFSFLACYVILDNPCEGQRPCLERPPEDP